MITKQYTITSAQGLHARPATTLIRLVKNFKSIVNIQKGGKTVRLNSMINLLSLTIKGGETITITKHGVPVAKLVPPSPQSRVSVQESIDAFREYRKGLRLNGLFIRELIEEGRH